MSGHNKWSKIKHKKASTDAKRSKLFTQIAKLIKYESKKGGGNLESPGLKAAIAQAKAKNVPITNIERAIAAGKEKDGEELTEIIYEAYGPGGVAIIIKTVTDSKNRTAAEIKHIFSKAGFSIATPGSAAFVFKKRDEKFSPITIIPVKKEDKEKLSNLIANIEEQEDVQDIITNAE